MKKKKKTKKTEFNPDEELNESTGDALAKEVDDLAENLDEFALGKKKKKKKSKAFNMDESEGADAEPSPADDADNSSSQPGPEAEPEGIDDGDLDFNLPKKKKKKKGKITFGEDEVLGGDDVVDEEGDESESLAAPSNASSGATLWANSDRDYTYDELLQHVFNIIKEKNPDMIAGEKRRLVMRPPQVLRVGTKKSSFANFLEICKS